MTRKDSTDTLANVSSFLIKKSIDNVCDGEVDTCKNLRNGSILIKTTNLLQANKLVKLTAITQAIKIDISEHNSLNFSKGVIYWYDLREISEKETLKELQQKNNSEVKKIIKREGYKLKETGLIIVTFQLPNLPNEINVGSTRFLSAPTAKFQPATTTYLTKNFQLLLNIRNCKLLKLSKKYIRNCTQNL